MQAQGSLWEEPLWAPVAPAHPLFPHWHGVTTRLPAECPRVTWTSLCVVRVKLTELSVQPSMWMSGGGIAERTSKSRQGRRAGRTQRS